MKSTFNFIITISIIYFSFYYTNLVSNYIKNKDPIMIEIKNNQDKYYKDPINAIILNNTIIPGLNGKIINIEETYQKMKKVNSYHESLLVFNEIEPFITINNNQDKIIINGNNNLRNISVLLKINNLDILKKIINNDNKNINLILSTSFIKENYDFLNSLENNIVVNQDEDINNLNLVDYCYTINIDSGNKCIDNNKFSILPTFITHNYYYNTYQIIKNGSILAYTITDDKNIVELNILLSAIRNLGYKIVNIDELLKE